MPKRTLRSSRTSSASRTLRRPLVVGNWKMYLSDVESLRAAESLKRLVKRQTGDVDIVICPSFPLLPDVRAALAKNRILVGAQDVRAESSGPHTGDVSILHIRRWARYVIVGHSERRQHHGETNADVARKVHAVLRAGLRPVACVGETAAQRDAGETVAVIRGQAEEILRDISGMDHGRLTLAYEPVWAVRPDQQTVVEQPDPRDVVEIVRLIRRVAAEHHGTAAAERLRLLYGGSVTVATVKQFVGEPGVDGVLVGAASTKPAEFAAIIKEVLASTHQRDHASPRGHSGRAVQAVASPKPGSGPRVRDVRRNGEPR